jgi:hypothetical protein
MSRTRQLSRRPTSGSREVRAKRSMGRMRADECTGASLSLRVILVTAMSACGSSAHSNGADAGSVGKHDGGSGSGSDSGRPGSGSGSGGDGGHGSAGDSGGPGSGSGDAGRPPSSAQTPGPSQDLFNNPYYKCLRNFYVSTSGSDSKDGTSPSEAWLTIAHADSSARMGGDCINVAPGTYAKFNEALSYGGSAATSSGYVTYRCTTPSFMSGTGCVIPDTGKAVCAGMYCSALYPSYLIFDGFDLVTNDQTVSNDVAFGCAGPGTFGTQQTSSLGCHHWWILNNVITGHGQAGVNINDTEFLYTVHNRVTQNAHMGCVGYYGSGIGYVVAKPVSGYTKTADDTNSSNDPSLNLMGVEGPDFPFNDVIAWNEVGNNYQGCTTLGNTDGNGIIIDTFNITTCNANMVDYPNRTLVAFNVVYNSGGGGVHVFSSANVTVANNSVYFNNSDPTQKAYARPGIDINCGAGKSGFGAGTDLFVNNIAYALPENQACPGPNGTYPGAEVPFNVGGDGTNVDGIYDSPGKNISYSVGTPCNATGTSGNGVFQSPPNAAWSCTANQCMTDPRWVDVGTTSQGSESTPPSGINFALQSGSPAIGSGATESYLPASSVDVGACSHTLTKCP